MRHIIIGGGILGASTAYHLAKLGEQVTVIDNHEQGQATKAGAGILCPWLTNRSNNAWYKLVTSGASFYPRLIDELCDMGITDTGYAKVGAINIFDTEEKLQRKYELALDRRRSSPEMGAISKLSQSETHKLFPVVSKQYHSLHINGAARVSGDKISKAMLKGAEIAGAQVKKGEAILDQSGRVFTDKEKIEGDRVIITSGAWAPRLLTPLGYQVNVTWEKAQIVHLKLPKTDTSQWPVMLPPYGHYQIGTENGTVLIGATKEKGKNDVKVTLGSVHQLLDKAIRVSPGLTEAEYIDTKVGFRPFTPNSIPAIGKIPGMSHVWFANGLGASGLTSGPYVGSELARLAAEMDSQLDLENYSVKKVFQ